MTVYQDLFVYQDGVYSKSQFSGNTPLGFHSVKIMGWGEENGIPYWVSQMYTTFCQSVYFSYSE